MVEDFSFSVFMALSEALAPTSLAQEGMTFISVPAGYEAHFDYEGLPYIVEMERKRLPIGSMGRGYEVENGFVLGLRGEDGYELTGTAGMGAIAIYRKMLTGLSELFKVTKVDAIAFGPYERKMLIPYEMMYRKFLLPDPPQGLGFIRVNDGIYLSKEYIRSHAEEMPPNLLKFALALHRVTRNEIKNIKRVEAKWRKKRREKGPQT